MGLSNELRLWGIALRELWQEEHQKHPYLHWVIAGFVFISMLIKLLLRWSESH